MFTATLASAALMAGTAYAYGSNQLGVGSAKVINSCSYPVDLANTPAAGGGFNIITQTLQTGGSYSQVYTELTNTMGWSIKLGMNGNMNNIMQFEYTFHNDGTIWYDLSDVNGNPWNGNWEITANGDCTPKQAAYQYATDDAYGMQSCPQASSVTVELCSGDAAGGSGSSGSSGSGKEAAPASAAADTETPSPATTLIPTTPAAAPATTAAASPSTESAVSEATSTTSYGGFQNGPGGYVYDNDVAVAQTTATPTLTTLVTSAVTNRGGVTVTNVVTEIATAFVTATAPAAKRHAHHPRHAHDA